MQFMIPSYIVFQIELHLKNYTEKRLGLRDLFLNPSIDSYIIKIGYRDNLDRCVWYCAMHRRYSFL